MGRPSDKRAVCLPPAIEEGIVQLGSTQPQTNSARHISPDRAPLKTALIHTAKLSQSPRGSPPPARRGVFLDAGCVR